MKATSEVSDALVISVLSLSPAERCHCSIYPRRYQCIGSLSRDSDKDDRGKVLMKSNFVFFQASADNKQVQCFTLYHRHIKYNVSPLRRSSFHYGAVLFVLLCGIM